MRVMYKIIRTLFRKMSFRQFLPRRLQQNYRSIMNGNLVQNKAMDDNNLRLLQALLNESQAQNQDEFLIQKTVQFLYRQNTSSFYKFLVKNRLAYVVLWTESKCIVRHLGLQGLVYIRWNQDKRLYEVHPHKNVLDRQSHRRQLPEQKEHTSVSKIASRVSCDLPEETTDGTEVETKTDGTMEIPEETTDGTEVETKTDGTMEIPEETTDGTEVETKTTTTRSWADITQQAEEDSSTASDAKVVPEQEESIKVDASEVNE